jgi:hypothetical protein
LANLSVDPYDELLPAIIAAQHSNPCAVEGSAIFVDRPMIDATDSAKEESQGKVVVGVWTYEVRIYVPAIDSRCGKVIILFQDILESDHFGALKTTEVVSWDF